MIGLEERIAESSTSTGTATITLAGPLTGAKTFSSISAPAYYMIPTLIEAVDANGLPTGDWEISMCELTSPTTLERRVLWRSSTGATVNFAAGTKHVSVVPLALATRMGLMGSRLCWAETDFLGTAGAATMEAHLPWDFAVISAGTQAKIASTANHPGILRISSSTTANSGGYCRTDVLSFLLSGGEYTECIFYPVTLTNTTIRFGFHDTTTSTDATDGVYLEVQSTGAVVGKTANNATRSTSATITTVTINTWYKGVIALNYNATAAWFGIYSETGTLLGSAMLTTNIPTTAGRETGHGVVATNSGTTALELVRLDYMNVGVLRPLTR